MPPPFPSLVSATVITLNLAWINYASRCIIVWTCPFVRLLPNLWTTFWKRMNRFDANGTSGPRGKDMKRSTLGSGCQTSRSREANDRFGGLAEASFSTLGSTTSCSFTTDINQNVYALKCFLSFTFCTGHTGTVYVCVPAVWTQTRPFVVA